MKLQYSNLCFIGTMLFFMLYLDVRVVIAATSGGPLAEPEVQQVDVDRIRNAMIESYTKIKVEIIKGLNEEDSFLPAVSFTVEFNPLCYSLYKIPSVNIANAFDKRLNEIKSSLMCGKTLVEKFKTSLVEDIACDTMFKTLPVDKHNTKCVASKDERKDKKSGDFTLEKKTTETCLVALDNAQEHVMLTFMLFENPNKRGIFRYVRLNDQPYTTTTDSNRAELRAETYRAPILNGQIRLDAQLDKLFSVPTTPSSCTNGTFRIVPFHDDPHTVPVIHL